MVLYVAYRASRKLKDRSLIPRRLRALGCTHVHKSFWKVEEEKANKVLKILYKNQPVLLKRIREIRKARFVKEKGISEFGSLVIVTYEIPKEAKREKIRNFLKKAPCIRLCRSVYAFCQEHSRFDEDNELVDTQRFLRFIQELQGNVKVIPRMVVVNSDSVEGLLEETKKRVEQEFSHIAKCSKELNERVSKGEEDIQKIHCSLSKLKRRFIAVKKVASYYEKWLGMNFTNSLVKTYATFRKIHLLVKEEQKLQRSEWEPQKPK
jgi:CRISPR/Cas system-associated endoribonuclease Cas2